MRGTSETATVAVRDRGYGEATTTILVERARDGDERAWNTIIDRYQGLVWSVVSGFRFDQATREDVSQAVWLKLLNHLDGIRDPERLGGWLAITAKRHAIDTQRKRDRLVLVGESIEEVVATAWDEEETTMTDSERTAILSAFCVLPDRMQELLRLLVADPPLTYKEIGELIGRPVGSIGPTRARALGRLRRAFIGEVGITGARGPHG